MKKTLLLLSAIFLCLLANSQDPHLTSWDFNSTGFATYNVGAGTVTTSDSADVMGICFDANYVYVRSEGMASYEMGPFTGNPNTPAGQGFIWKINRNPAPESGTHTSEPVTGPLGVAVNGVALYGKGDSRSYDPMSNSNSPMGLGIWNADAWVSEGATMDANGNGHPQQSGQYHYHANPSSLYTDPSGSHSPIIGWAFDGYPIYGPFGYTDPNDDASPIKRMECGYALRSITNRNTLPDGSASTPPGPTVSGSFPLGTYWEDYEYLGGADLDEYNGRFCVTPEYPSGTYAYFLSTDVSGDPAFPYMIGLEYYGVVSTADIQNGYNATIPGGVTCANGPIGIGVSETKEVLNNIYPNPANDIFTIELQDGTYQILITDYNGKLVHSNQTSSNKINISTTDFTTGIYLVRVLNDKGLPVGSKRLVVSH